MKKLVFLISFLFGTIYIANSQILISIIFGDKLNSDKLEFGLVVGASNSTILNLENAKYTSNFSLGMYFNIKMGERFWLHTGAIAKSTYGADNLSVYDLNDDTLNIAFQNASVKRDFGIINVPAFFRYQTKNGWGVELGPQFSLRTKVDDIFNVSFEDSRNKLIFRNDLSDSYKRITVEGTAGLYKKLRKGEGVTLNVRYNFSLYDILKDNNSGVSQYHSVFTFLVGIPIGKDKKPKELKEPEELPLED
jgi:DNA-binding XRE family transcriptional regulator